MSVRGRVFIVIGAVAAVAFIEAVGIVYLESRRGVTQDMTLLTLAIPAVVIVLLLLFGAFLARTLLDPLAAVARSARQISGGNFEVSLPPPPPGELGELVAAFREMAAAVQQRQHDVTEALAREREISLLLETQRAAAEREHQRLLATIDTVPVGVVIFDAATQRIVLQNRMAEEILGREPDDDGAREAYWASFNLRQRDGAPCPPDQWGRNRVLGGDVIIGEELLVTCPDGRVMPILRSGAPLRDEHQHIVGGVLAFQDITKLHEIDRLKDEFVAMVSHELRTPLTSIKGALQLMLAELPLEDPEHEALMNVAISNTDRLVRITNDILDVSKIEAGKMDLHPRTHAVGEVVSLSLQNVQHLALASSITITPVVEPGVPEVRVDLDRTIQILVNLLSNALKFAPPRSEVTVCARRESDGFVALSVTDRGRGIPPDKLGLLFQRFPQIEGPGTPKVPGTGLGLVIVKALAEAQGGRVRVESAVGLGSTFTVTVPPAA